MNESENYETSLGAEVCEQISAEDTMDATVGDASEANIVEEYVDDWSDDKGNYETYKKMTSMEKAQMHGFRELKSYDTVRSIVQMKFLDMGHIADVDELLEETDLLYKGMCELVVKNKTEEVLDEIKQRGIALMICLLSRRQGCYSFSQTIIHTIFSCTVLFARRVEWILLMRIRYLKIIRLFMKRHWRCNQSGVWKEGWRQREGTIGVPSVNIGLIDWLINWKF